MDREHAIPSVAPGWGCEGLIFFFYSDRLGFGPGATPPVDPYNTTQKILKGAMTRQGAPYSIHYDESDALRFREVSDFVLCQQAGLRQGNCGSVPHLRRWPKRRLNGDFFIPALQKLESSVLFRH